MPSGPRIASSWRSMAEETARTLDPSYFSIVMAVGIVSVDTHDDDLPGLSVALLWTAAICYVALVVLNARRLLGHRRAVRRDLADPHKAFGFFTFVAATGVLGDRLLSDGHRDVAVILLIVALVAWFVLGYLVPWASVLSRARRRGPDAADGTWFVWVVATQSVAVLAAAIEPTVRTGRRELALLAVCCWSIGIFLYGFVGVLVASRLLRHRPRPADITPPYWVAMGATAITVVAGAQIAVMAEVPALAATRRLIAGTSVIFWAFGTWLIPALVAVFCWRHVVHRVPLRYEAAWWSLVFPLGMYAAAGHHIGDTDDLPLVDAIGTGEGWVAIVVCLGTLAAMLVHLGRPVVAALRGGPRHPL